MRITAFPAIVPTMPAPPDPWSRRPAPSGSRRFRGLFPWLVLLVLAGLGLWALMRAFPGVAGDEDAWIDLIRLLGVLALVSSGILFAPRFGFGEMLRNIAVWTAIAGVLAIGYSYRFELAGVADRVSGGLLPDRAREVAPGVVQLQAGRGGHYYVMARVNGADIRFLIDTGASAVVLSPADAKRAGFDPDALAFTQRFETANGIGEGAPVRLRRLEVGPIRVDDLPASVNRAAMRESLLGMSFLNRLEGFSFENDTLTLRAR